MSVYSFFLKRSNIPGTPKDSDFGIMNTKSDSETVLTLKANNVAGKAPTGHYYIDSINPLVCGLIFITMTAVGVFIALTVNYKTRAILDNLSAVENEQNVSKDIELGEVNASYDDSPKEVPPPNNLQYYDKYKYDVVYDADILNPRNNIPKALALNTKLIKRISSISSEKINNSGTTLISNSLLLKQAQYENISDDNFSYEIDTQILEKEAHSKRLPQKDILAIKKLYTDMIKGGSVFNIKSKTYSYEYINNVNRIDDYESDINMKNLKNCPVSLQMQPFVNKKEAMKSIILINHFLFRGKIPLAETHTIEILLFKLVSMLVNATENGYCYQKTFCDGLQSFFNKGTIINYFFAIDNYLLQDCLVSAFLGYFQGHCMFPYLGNTSFINYTYQITDGFQVDEIYNESYTMILTMFLNFHMLFQQKSAIYNDALENKHNEYISRKLNEFLDYYLSLIPNDDASYIVNQVINKLLKSVEIMEKQSSTQSVFLYLQSILKIYSKHQICCLKKKNNAHISLKTDVRVYKIMMEVLNAFGSSNNLIIKVIKSFSLILEDEGFPEELRLKLEEVINKENQPEVLKPKIKNIKPNNAPLNVHPGSWNI